jgi:hypothetical protein
MIFSPRLLDTQELEVLGRIEELKFAPKPAVFLPGLENIGR